MTAGLTWLGWTAALAFVQMCATAGLLTATQGLGVALGNRAGFAPPEGVLARAMRAHRNMVESFAVFAAAMLTVHIAGRENALSTLGGALFFFGRLAYLAIYVAGIPYARTVAWSVAVAGILLVLLPLF